MSTASPSPGVHEIDWLAPVTREILNIAQQEAIQMKARKVYPEHLLLGIIVHGKSKAAALLHINGIDATVIRDYIQNALGSNNTPSDSSLLPFSTEALECVERAIALIVYYLTRHRSSAIVAPEHLLLSILRHARMQGLFASFSNVTEKLETQLLEGAAPGFVRHMENLFLFPEPAVKERGRKIVSVVSLQKNHKPAASVTPTHPCPACQQPMQAYWKHCVYCGATLTKKCATCGTSYPDIKGAKFCFECGSELM